MSNQRLNNAEVSWLFARRHKPKFAMIDNITTSTYRVRTTRPPRLAAVFAFCQPFTARGHLFRLVLDLVSLIHCFGFCWEYPDLIHARALARLRVQNFQSSLEKQRSILLR